MNSHKWKSSRDPRSIQETHSAAKRTLTEHQEVRDLRADKATEGEEAALSRLSEARQRNTSRFLKKLEPRREIQCSVAGPEQEVEKEEPRRRTQR